MSKKFRLKEQSGPHPAGSVHDKEAIDTDFWLRRADSEEVEDGAPPDKPPVQIGPKVESTTAKPAK